jgi:hypothetical protein
MKPQRNTQKNIYIACVLSSAEGAFFDFFIRLSGFKVEFLGFAADHLDLITGHNFREECVILVIGSIFLSMIVPLSTLFYHKSYSFLE